MSKGERGGARRRRVPTKSRFPDLEVLDRGRPRTDKAFLRGVVAATLSHVGRPEMHVSLLLTDDAEIARLHESYLGDASPTDVISFALDGEAELVVSVETAKRTARRCGHTVRAEVALYVVHGILHTTGFNDMRARDRARMRRAEREVMKSLGLRVRAVDE
ncbi:MAG: rRNA maturation RNase YbeY [Planctomycetota bacterium]